jgi:hypothetical protein
MRDYSYDHNKTNYSKPVLVELKGLSLPVATNETQRLELKIDNNDRNVQLLLPMDRWRRISRVRMPSVQAPAGSTRALALPRPAVVCGKATHLVLVARPPSRQTAAAAVV